MPAIFDELLKYRAKALGIRARKLPLDDQRRMAFLDDPQPRKLPVCFPAPLRLPDALVLSRANFAPAGWPLDTSLECP